MPAKYLLDSDFCVNLLRDAKGSSQSIRQFGWNNCFISEITVSELLYGAECSGDVEHSKQQVLDFTKDINIIHISGILAEFARQKALLRRKGTPINDFDLLIGCTAVVYDFVMVTNNVKHMQRIENIKITNI